MRAARARLRGGGWGRGDMSTCCSSRSNRRDDSRLTTSKCVTAARLGVGKLCRWLRGIRIIETVKRVALLYTL